MKLKITKEKVLEAAEKCSQAKETLKTLFPECFEKEMPKISNCVDIRIDDGRGIETRSKAFGDGGSNVLWLSEAYNWEIREAKRGGYLLIANYK